MPLTYFGLSFEKVFGELLEGAPSMVFAIFCGRFLNLYTITKLKMLTRGRYFWLRSIFACLIGDLITLTLVYSIIFHNLPFSAVSQLYFSDLFVRVSYSIVGGGPAVLVVNYLKKKEGLDVYDHGTNFNPFKFSLSD
ncbi:MAG TPA: VUT family protein [Gammaproteobacteria bacterium]|nr:VUT family protein [Gammaproteobacteria bacterium]